MQTFTTFKLELDGGNAAMATHGDIAAALRELADKIDSRGNDRGTIRDTNGNTIGEWKIA